MKKAKEKTKKLTFDDVISSLLRIEGVKKIIITNQNGFNSKFNFDFKFSSNTSDMSKWSYK